MTRANEQQHDRIHEERREQIKKAALKVFACKGIAGTKMSMIAAEAGISQGLSYRYFNSKEELFTELVKDAMEEARESVKNVGHLPGTPLEQIRTFTESMLDESHKLFFLLIRHAQTSEEVPETAKRLLDQYSAKDTIDLLVPVFIKGQQEGQFCEGDPRRLLLLYLSVITGLMVQEVQADEGGWQQEVDQLMRIITK